MLTKTSKFRIVAISAILTLLISLAPSFTTYSLTTPETQSALTTTSIPTAASVPATRATPETQALTTLTALVIPAGITAPVIQVTSEAQIPATSTATAVPASSSMPVASAIMTASTTPAAATIPTASAFPVTAATKTASAIPNTSSTPAATTNPTATTAKTASTTSAASPASGGVGSKPYMGWSSWSLEATTQANYGKNWLNEENVKRMSDYMQSTGLQAAGYTYINIDAGWWSDYNWNPGFDSYGRPAANSNRFPGGISGMAAYVHSKGQKLGIYFVCGLDVNVYNANSPIYGTSYHARDIAYKPLTKTNGWKGAYAINWSHPGAQAYIDSIAKQFAAWGVDFVKLDGITPNKAISASSVDNRGDVNAWSVALKNSGRPIWYTISWSLDHAYASTWKQYANGIRIDTDVESYGSTLVTWGNSVDDRFSDLPKWLDDIGNGTWADLDSLNIGCGQSIDGISNTERQSYMTLWAIASSPLYVGDDLGRLDSYGKSLLTNSEVIAINQSALIPKQITSGNHQVWASKNPDGSYNVALFNLSGSTSPTTVNWRDLGLSGSKKVRDLWTKKDLGKFTSQYSVKLASHGSRFIKVYP